MQPMPRIGKIIVLLCALMNSIAYTNENLDQSSTRAPHQARDVTFTSKLTDDKKGYNLYIHTFSPSKFKLTINGHKVKDGHSVSIPVENNKFLIRYDYEFRAFGRTFAGYREVEFGIDPHRDHYSIDFSWKHDHRFIIHHAQFIRITQIHEPGSEHAR